MFGHGRGDLAVSCGKNTCLMSIDGDDAPVARAGPSISTLTFVTRGLRFRTRCSRMGGEKIQCLIWPQALTSAAISMVCTSFEAGNMCLGPDALAWYGSDV